jgi:putative salt-induced outer membrane protein YdiY
MREGWFVLARCALGLGAALIATPAQAQASADGGAITSAPIDPAERAANAAEAAQKAAEAAQSAAQAAQVAAEAAQKIAQANPGQAPTVTPTPTPAENAPVSPWKATLGAGLISLTGNTSSITFNSNVLVERKLGLWTLSGKAIGTYGQSRPIDGSVPQVLALNGSLLLRGDRQLLDWVSVYVLGGVDTDHVKSVEFRVYGEPGTGLTWLNQEKETRPLQLYLRTDLGLRVAQESRFQYYPTIENIPDVTLVAPRLAIEFRATLKKDLQFVQTGEVMQNVYGPSRTVVNTLSKLSVHLISSLSLGVSFTIAYDSDPAPGKVPTDTALSLTLDYSI